MAVTTYGVNDALAVKLWSKKLAVEALKATAIAPLIGRRADSIIHLKEELSGPGDKVTFGLRTQLIGDGVTENETLEGNEESLTTYADAVFINELAHAVRVTNKQRISPKRVPFDLRDEAKVGASRLVRETDDVSASSIRLQQYRGDPDQVHGPAGDNRLHDRPPPGVQCDDHDRRRKLGLERQVHAQVHRLCGGSRQDIDGNDRPDPPGDDQRRREVLSSTCIRIR